MATSDALRQYFAFESRVASFQTASKRRQSNASSKASKALKWPHKFLSGEDLAKAGFFYQPSQSNPDNVTCFLCHGALDGWEEGDNPFAEHLKHSPDCGWAIVAAIERDHMELTQEYPCSARMIGARKATFANMWPHEAKKGWKCKTKQMVDAGWKYTPSPDSDDMATCAYCALSLDGWEPSDKPLDEHFNRSPDCPFFTLINDQKQSPAVSRTKAKKGRASKASRLSTQSAFTVALDAPGDLPAEEGDSILTTATNATTATQASQKMGRKGAAAARGKKTKAKKNEAVEVEQSAPEPEDDDFSVKVHVTPKANRGKKRKSEQMEDPETSTTAVLELPQPKRRTTRTRGSMAVDESVLGYVEATVPALKSAGRKGRPSSRSTRKVSGAASVVSLRAGIPNDDELDQALEADLERHSSDDGGSRVDVHQPLKRATRGKASQEDHAMFAPAPTEVDEAVIDAEMEALEAETKPLPKAKGAKGKQPRKVSAKQQAASRKAAEAEAEAEAERIAEQESSLQIVTELEHSISLQHSSPVAQPQRQRAASRQRSQQPNARGTRGSAMLANDNDASMATTTRAVTDEEHDESGNETDASKASQSTVIRGASVRRASKPKGGQVSKVLGRSIEEIVQKPAVAAQQLGAALTVATEKSTKPKARTQKAAATISVEESATVIESIEKEAAVYSNIESAKGKESALSPRLVSPAPKEITPAFSPQSSDAENHPPSSKPSLTNKKPSTPHTNARRVPLAATPMLSPSKRNIIAGLQSTEPWTALDLETVFLQSPNSANHLSMAGDAVTRAKNGDLTSPERKMSVEEWILFNARVAEEKLRGECERMVGIFESEGTRAMRALEGVECIE